MLIVRDGNKISAHIIDTLTVPLSPGGTQQITTRSHRATCGVLMGLEHGVDQRLDDVAERFRIGQISAVVSYKITVTTSGGASLTVPRLATWASAIGDIVVLALTPGGLVALGEIA